MKKLFLFLLLPVFLLSMAACSDDGDDNNSGDTTPGGTLPGDNGNGNGSAPGKIAKVAKSNTDTKVWAHFMVWYVTPDHKGGWGQHWYKGGEQPYYDEEEGAWVNLFTRYPPLTGPYYSADPYILEYQLLLMKYAGIDGVIPDWYGVSDRGLPEDKTTNMDALWAMTKKVGLELAVCYEEQFKSNNRQTALDDVVKDLKYLRSEYFNSASYSKIDGKPMLLVFGPQKWTAATFWEEVFNTAFTSTSVPAFFTLYGKSPSFPARGLSYGQYNWPNNCEYTKQYTSMMDNGQKAYIAGAWPGMYDCYYGTETDEHKFGKTEHRGGQEFKDQLDLARQQKPKYLQIATWNDYGEGTIIEPTVPNVEQNGGNPYVFLKQLQEFTGVKYTELELKNIKRFYDLRVKYRTDAAKQETLNKVFAYFNELKPEMAAELMDTIE